MSLLAVLVAILPSLVRADGQFPQLTARQDWCTDGSFRFVVQSSGTMAPADDRDCVTLAKGTVEFPFEFHVDQTPDGPVGNFLDRLYAMALNRKDMSYKGAPTEVREYWVRFGACGTIGIVAVQTIVPSLLPDGLNLNRELCDFSRSTRVRSNLPLAGVYLREGRTISEFLEQLTGQPGKGNGP